MDITEKKTDIQRIWKDIGMVFQHFNLFSHMTVMENMVYAPVRVNHVAKGFAREVSDRICFIDEGRILEDTTPEIFFANPGTDRARAFLQKVL